MIRVSNLNRVAPTLWMEPIHNLNLQTERVKKNERK